MRRYGEAIDQKQHYRPRKGAYAVIFNGAQILTTCQLTPKPEIQLPGGGIDAGESPIAALHREVLEETGWRIQVMRHVGSYRRFVYMEEYDLWAEKICAVYFARPIIKLGAPREKDHRAVFLHPQDAMRLVATQGERAFIQRLLTP